MQCTDAIAFEAAAALEAYEERLLAVRAGAPPHALAVLQRALRRVCGCCMRLPQLSAASVSLLLAHHRMLAQLARGGREAGADETCARNVEQCLALLQRRCRQLFLASHLQ